MTKVVVVFILSFMALGGCVQTSTLVKAKSNSLRTDIFEEVATGGVAQQGYTVLHFTAILKTHLAGSYSPADVHGTPDYKLLVNIDGQADFLRAVLQKEHAASLNLIDPEAGGGVRYRFIKDLRLKPGVHRIAVALPDEGIVVEREINLSEGKVNNLVVEPVYSAKSEKRRPGIYSTETFSEGIRTLRLMLNGRELNQ